MSVAVDKARRDDQPDRVDHFAAFGYVIAVAQQPHHAAIFHEDTLAGINSLRRIYDVAVSN